MADEAQIATLQANQVNMAANQANMAQEMSALRKEVQASSTLSSSQNVQILTQLAVLNTQQISTAKYQAECDAERKELKDTVAGHSNILTGMKVRNGLIAGFTSAIVGGITAIAVAIAGAPHK